MTHEQQERAIRVADALDRLGATLVDFNARLRIAEEDAEGLRPVLDAFDAFVGSTLTELTDLSMQIRPARIVRPGE